MEAMKLSKEQLVALETSGIPDYMQGGLIRYFENRLPPGDFLTAVLSNNLKESFNRADDTNTECMKSYVRWLYWQAPIGAYGSYEKVIAWLDGDE